MPTSSVQTCRLGQETEAPAVRHKGTGKGAASLAGRNRFAPKCTEQHPSFSPLLVSLALTSLLCRRKESCPALLGAEAPFCVGLHRVGETPSALRALWQRLLIPMRSWVYSVGGRLLFSVLAVISDSFRGRGRVDSCSNHLLSSSPHVYVQSTKAQVQRTAN